MGFLSLSPVYKKNDELKTLGRYDPLTQSTAIERVDREKRIEQCVGPGEKLCTLRMNVPIDPT